MNFKGHSTGGAVTASMVTALGGLAHLKGVPLNDPNLIVLWLVSYGFSLYPDVDTKSTPQKILFRLLFPISIGFMYLGMFELCSMVLTIAILPLMFKHRGFTHWWICALSLPAVLFLGVEYLIAGQVVAGVFIMKYGWYIIGGSLGWMTHLVLDKV